MSHTPGPWTEGVQDLGPHGVEVNLVDDYDTPHDIIRGESGFDYQTTLANMALIAAAPELLDALKGLMERIIEEDRLWLNTSAYKAAELAIAKAEGK